MFNSWTKHYITNLSYYWLQDYYNLTKIPWQPHPQGYQRTKDKVIPVRKPTRQRQYKQAKHGTNKEPNTIVAPATEADQRGIAPEKNDNKAYQWMNPQLQHNFTPAKQRAHKDQSPSTTDKQATQIIYSASHHKKHQRGN
jgi:hypothetical protein